MCVDVLSVNSGKFWKGLVISIRGTSRIRCVTYRICCATALNFVRLHYVITWALHLTEYVFHYTSNILSRNFGKISGEFSWDTVWIYIHLRITPCVIQCYRAKTVLFVNYNAILFVRFSWYISRTSGNFEITENLGKCREIFYGKIPGNFPPDFPGFSGDTTYVTALILSFRNLKIEEISINFGRKFPGNSGRFSPKTSGNFPRSFLRFFNWNVCYSPNFVF